MYGLLKKSALLKSFLVFCLIFGLMTTSVFANFTEVSKQYKPQEKVNVKVVSEQITENSNTFRIQVTDTDKISTRSVTYFDVAIYGSGGKIYGKITRFGTGAHKVTIGLYSGSSSANTLVGTPLTTSNVGTVASPTTISATPAQTQMWKVKVDGTLEGTKFTYSTYEFLFNKKGVEYPKYTDPLSKKVMTVPPTGWTKVSNPLPVLTQKERDTYRAWYEKTYNGGKVIDWTNLPIHHIKPRAYGGTHAYENLMPLDSSFHSTVTSWWVNY